jgi:tetratricopeptide (TPR) repeat protein
MPPKPRKPAPKPAQKPAQKPARKGWGSVARKGADVVKEDQETASRIWREAVKRARDHGEGAKRPDEDWTPERVERERRPAKTTAPAPRRRDTPRTLSPESAAELANVKGPRGAPRLQQRLAEAARAYERNRYQDARRLLKPLADAAPAAPSVRELHGLTLYELGKWREAAKELESFRALTGSVEQHPVLADCYRALKRYKVVDELWEELRQASPSAELVAEGRIVAAGARADRGDIAGAIAVLEKAKLDVKHPKQHHLRLQYALADLYERAGDIPRAREIFQRIMRHDPRFFDTAERVKSLG